MKSRKLSGLIDFEQQEVPDSIFPLLMVSTMKRNSLLDIANTVCQMLYSRRLRGDRDKLVSLPAGTIAVNLLNGEAKHDSAGQLDVTFSSTLADWVRRRCLDEGISPTLLNSAMLTIVIDPDLPHPTDELGPFDRWSARCEIVTGERPYVGELRELGKLRPMF